MPLQIKRGTTAQRLSIIPLLGELIYDTNLQTVFVGDGATLGGISAISGITVEEAQDVVGQMFLDGVHKNIIFNYGPFQDTANRIDVELDLQNYEGEISAAAFKGSLFADNSSLLIDAVDGSINLDGTVKGNIIPDQNEQYDLGSNSNRFRDLYLSGSSLKLGDATITSIGSSINLPAGSTVGGIGIGTGSGNGGGGDFVFKLAADDSIQVLVTNGNTVQFVGGLNIETSVDIDGIVTIQTDSTNINVDQLTTSLLTSEDSSPIRINVPFRMETFCDIDDDLVVNGVLSARNIGIFGGGSLRITNPLNTIPIIATANFNSNISSTLRFTRGRGTTQIPLAVQQEDKLTNIDFQAYDGTQYITTANISSTVVGSVSPGIIPSEINLSVRNHSGNLVTPLSILSSPLSDISVISFNRCGGDVTAPLSINPGDQQHVLGFNTFDGNQYIQTANIFTFSSHTVSPGNIPTTMSFNVMDRSGILRTVASLNDYGTFNINRYNYESNMLNFNQVHNTADSSNVSFFRARGTPSSLSASLPGDDIVDIVFFGHDGTSFQPTLSIESRIVSISGSDIVSDLNITMNNGSTVSSRFILESQGTIDFKQSVLVAGPNPGEVDISSPVNYMRVKLNGVEYALPLFAINS